ncbi:MAG: hypothetical protein WBZ36_31240 [Candidatus Nitrosopolaris sp.]
MSSGRPNAIKLNRISHDRNCIEYVRSRLKHTESVLEQLHLEEKKRYTQAQIQTIDSTVTLINALLRS